MSGKVFCVGMFKTGTKSFGAAMNILGYRGLYRPWFILKDNWYKNTKLWKQYYPKIIERAKGYNAFSDAPWMFVYPLMDKIFPNSKFVLTLRKDPITLAKSDSAQWGHKKNKPSMQQFIDRYETNNERVRKYFKGRDCLLEMCFEKGDGWRKLCKFLNKDIPNRPFPHLNKRKKR